MTLDPIALDQAADLLATRINLGDTNALQLVSMLLVAGVRLPLINLPVLEPSS